MFNLVAGQHLRDQRKLRYILDKIGIQDWIGPRCRVEVKFIDGVRSWKEWLQAAPCSYAGGFKEDQSGLHAYIMMRRQGIKSNTN